MLDRYGQEIKLEYSIFDTLLSPHFDPDAYVPSVTMIWARNIVIIPVSSTSVESLFGPGVQVP